MDALVGPFIEAGWLNGVVVGIVSPEGRAVRGYGLTSAKGGRKPDGTTVFEIGSATKAFTGTLLAEMAARGEVSPGDPVQRYLPATVKVPRYDNQEITLEHLATHTAALPRVPPGEPRDPQNPYAHYTIEETYAFLSGYQLPRKPGETSEYSNLGMGFLGHVLALRAGKSYEALVVERICRPLAMKSTRITLDPSMRRRLAPGHDADGLPARNWDIPTLAGAGALRSTVDDLLRFLSANMGLTPSPLLPVFQEARRPRWQNRVALGWQIDADPGVIWHNGQTGGYHCFIGFLPGRKVGVAVLSNTASMRVDEIGLGVLSVLLGRKVEAPKLRKPVKVDAVALQGLVGEYPLAPTFVLTVTREGGQLYAQATGQERFRVYPESPSKFFYKVVDAQLTFERDGAGRVTGLVLHQGGRDIRAPKAAPSSP